MAGGGARAVAGEKERTGSESRDSACARYGLGAQAEWQACKRTVAGKGIVKRSARSGIVAAVGSNGRPRARGMAAKGENGGRIEGGKESRHKVGAALYRRLKAEAERRSLALSYACSSSSPWHFFPSLFLGRYFFFVPPASALLSLLPFGALYLSACSSTHGSHFSTPFRPRPPLFPVTRRRSPAVLHPHNRFSPPSAPYNCSRFTSTSPPLSRELFTSSAVSITPVPRRAATYHHLASPRCLFHGISLILSAGRPVPSPPTPLSGQLVTSSSSIETRRCAAVDTPTRTPIRRVNLHAWVPRESRRIRAKSIHGRRKQRARERGSRLRVTEVRVAVGKELKACVSSWAS